MTLTLTLYVKQTLTTKTHVLRAFECVNTLNLRCVCNMSMSTKGIGV